MPPSAAENVKIAYGLPFSEMGLLLVRLAADSIEEKAARVREAADRTKPVFREHSAQRTAVCS